LLVADGDALVLAEVLVPGGDNELFDDPARVGARGRAGCRATRRRQR